MKIKFKLKSTGLKQLILGDGVPKSKPFAPVANKTIYHYSYEKFKRKGKKRIKDHWSFRRYEEAKKSIGLK
jgi:hypothetical protein